MVALPLGASGASEWPFWEVCCLSVQEASPCHLASGKVRSPCHSGLRSPPPSALWDGRCEEVLEVNQAPCPLTLPVLEAHTAPRPCACLPASLLGLLPAQCLRARCMPGPAGGVGKRVKGSKQTQAQGTVGVWVWLVSESTCLSQGLGGVCCAAPPRGLPLSQLLQTLTPREHCRGGAARRGSLWGRAHGVQAQPHAVLSLA